jgi:hypothetical protein
MKYLFISIFSLVILSLNAQPPFSGTKYDTLVNNRDSIVLKVSTFRDSALFNSFITKIVDTTTEIKRYGFLWQKKVRIETHVFGPKRDYVWGPNPNATLVCTEPYGISYFTKISKK